MGMFNDVIVSNGVPVSMTPKDCPKEIKPLG